jgi:hypothetical protein
MEKRANLVIIQAEPADLLMVRYKLYLNQHCPDPEDPWVVSYLQEHGLEPRRQLDEEHDGAPYKVLHFGQCYLGRHIEAIGKLYQRGIEYSALAQHIRTVLDEAPDATVRGAMTALDEDALRTRTDELAAQLHVVAQFEVTPENDLRVTVDVPTVVQAFLDWTA